jgi:oligopeptidase A
MHTLETSHADNPLLDAAELPPFERIVPSHVLPAVQALLVQADAALERAIGPEVPDDWVALSAVLEVATERLGSAWHVAQHLNSVADTPEMRAAFNAALGPVTEFHTRLGADRRLYAKYRAIAATADAAAHPMASERRRALDIAIRDFVLSGAALEGPARERYAKIRERQAEIAQAFSEHVLDATDRFALDVEPERLDGLPPDAQAAARAAAERAGVSGARLTLHAPSYVPAMQHLRDRNLRERLYTAYVTRASDLGDPSLDNSALIAELLALREEEAALLGHPNYAELSLVPKMAPSATEVLEFLRDLARRARPQALRDITELEAFARAELGLPRLEPWDLPFAAERLKEARYAFSETELKAYFTLPRVLHGLFHICETLFDIAIEADVAPTWHESVQVYRIAPRGQPSRTLARFFLDLHARPGKQPGAWMSPARSRWARPDRGGALQLPVAYLVCNFASPQGERPALLSHRDVITLFHEFGHGLHHLLTQVQELAVSGVGGVEWDAVELPSQFMENFAWEWDVLRRMTAHVDTGEPLPRALFDRMVAARNFHSALAMLRQIEFGLLDMRLHTEHGSAQHLQRISDEVRAEVSVVPAAPFVRIPHAFAHIFAGGYAAGYYSYKWAEVLSADAFAAFEETGVLDEATGRRYRREILEAGGSRPAMASFEAFRGRAPTLDALLRHQGLG